LAGTLGDFSSTSGTVSVLIGGIQVTGTPLMSSAVALRNSSFGAGRGAW